MRKKEKRNCKSITIAEIIALKQNPRTRQPRTAVFMLSDSRTEGVAAAEGGQDTLCVCYQQLKPKLKRFCYCCRGNKVTGVFTLPLRKTMTM